MEERDLLFALGAVLLGVLGWFARQTWTGLSNRLNSVQASVNEIEHDPPVKMSDCNVARAEIHAKIERVGVGLNQKIDGVFMDLNKKIDENQKVILGHLLDIKNGNR